MSDGTLILLAGSLLALGITATLVAGRLRVPGLVIFLALGMLIGSDGLGLVQFGHSLHDVELARTIGVVALALILFEGGLAAGWAEIRPVLWPSLSLAVFGTVITAAVVGLAAAWLLDLSTLEGLLLGSIVAATDGAAVFSVLRGSSIKRRAARVLEAESGLNDPVAIVLVLGAINAIQQPDYGVADVLWLSFRELAVGGAIGFIAGRLATEAFSKVRLATPGLYPVASMAAAGLAFGVADAAHGSGFLAVYATGLALGSAAIPARRTIADFHDGLAWVSQIAVFFTLGLLVFPSDLIDVAGDALLIAAVLMFVARPLAAFVSTTGMGFQWREKLLLGWAGLRGAVPIVLATFPVIDHVPEANSFFDIVFFVVLASTVIQGVSFEALARTLHLTTEEPAVPRPLLEVGNVRRLGAEVLEFPVREDDAAVGKPVRHLDLPREALVNVIVRGEEALLPRGSTEIAAGDRLHILVRQPQREAVEGLFERWRDGPLGDPDRPPVAPTFGRAAIFSVRPWEDAFGEPSAPRFIADIAVARTLRQRRDSPGALVQLEDGRYAVTAADRAATGGTRQLFRYCNERIRDASDDQARAWWQEVAGVLSQDVVR